MRNKLLFFLLLLPVFLLAQSPQAVNFRAYLDMKSPLLTGDSLWIPCGYGGLIRYDINTGSQSLYKPDNANMTGGLILDMKQMKNGTFVGIKSTYSRVQLFTFDGTNFTDYPLLSNGDSLYSIYYLSTDTLGNAYALASVIPVGGTVQNNYNVYDVIKFDGNDIVRLNCPINTYSPDLTVLPNGELFLLHQSSTTANIYQYDGTNWAYSTFTVNNTYYNFLVDINTDLWLVPARLDSGVTSYTFYQKNGANWIPNPVTFNIPAPNTVFVVDYEVDANNKMYLACYNGLIIRNGLGMVFKPYNSPLSAQSSNYMGIKGIEKDTSGNIWAVYSDMGDLNNFDIPSQAILQFDGTNWQTYPIQSDIHSNMIYWLKIDKWNKKWAYSYKNLFLFAGNNWQRIDFPPNMDRLIGLNAIDIDMNGNLWAIFQGNPSSMENLYRYDGDSWIFVRLVDAASSLSIDNNGRILITGQNCNVMYFHNGSVWQNISLGLIPPLNIPSYINMVTADESNFFWLINDNNQLLKFDGSNMIFAANLSPLSYIEAMNVDRTNHLWVNNYRFDLNNMPSYTMYDSKYGTTDLSGNVWIGKQDGLYKQNGAGWTKYDMYNADFMVSGKSEMVVDNANNLWLMDLGVTVFNESGIPNNSIQTYQAPFSGNIYYDLNGNGQKDITEYSLPNQQVLVLPDSAIRISSLAGNYHFYPDTGNYILQMQPFPNWQITSDSIEYHATTNPGGITGLDFGINALVPNDSLEVHVYGSTNCNVVSTNFWFSYKNKGNTILDGDVILTLDSLTTLAPFSPNYPQATQLSTYTYSWHFQDLLPFETRNIDCLILMPNGTYIGSLIDISVTVAANNISTTGIFSDTLTCAWDPNDKTAFFPANSTQGQEVLYNTPFEYLIRFQNTGNDVAFNVTIEDTISSNFDMQTFEFIAASHPHELLYEMNGIVRFHFPNIMLPDSGTNEPASHGFVSYRVKPKQGLPNNTPMENTAYIYFDENPAVVTNTTQHTLVNAFTAISEEINALQVQFYPNPFDQNATLLYNNPTADNYSLHIYDLTGKKVQTYQDKTGRILINRNGLSVGMYLYRLEGKNIAAGKMVVRDF